MLVYLGVASILSVRKAKQSQPFSTTAPGEKISYLKSTIIGLVHGLAGSAAMVLLTMSTVKNVWEGALYILIFGVGTIVGMLFFTTIIGLPFVFSTKKIGMNQFLTMVTGAVSALFGIYYMYYLGFVEGLFI